MVVDRMASEPDRVGEPGSDAEPCEAQVCPMTTSDDSQVLVWWLAEQTLSEGYNVVGQQ